MSRIKNASRNIAYGYLGTFLTLLLRFISRTVFIHTIGVTFLGVEGLYTNILSVLSFAELGIGTAMNYSLYKPVAFHEREKIKSLMRLYKRAYLSIAGIISVIGLALVPFLSHLITDPGAITSNELILYYLIFLFNTVSTYFVAYKFSLVNAEQKNYIQTNIRTLTTVVTVVAQIIILFLYKNFLLYLLVAASVEMIQKVVLTIYLNKRYPYLLEKDVEKLSEDELKPIKRNIKALVFHKIGDVSVHQTDNILISSFINISTVGIVSNYTLLIASATSFINILFSSVVSGFGNLIATESVEKQYFLFKVYRFVCFWIYGFASIAFIILLSPFIEIWLGPQMIIPQLVIFLMIADYYMKGHRIVINNFKTAAGIFNEDKYISLIQALVNLAVSIYFVRRIGLPGIYIGTVVQGLVSTLTRPIIVYRKVFKLTGKEYFIDSIRYLMILCLPLALLLTAKHVLAFDNKFLQFVVLMLLVVIVPNGFFLAFLQNREEFFYLKQLLRKKLGKDEGRYE
jgi:O-antigen/teichoic acid export membrane protein